MTSQAHHILAAQHAGESLPLWLTVGSVVSLSVCLWAVAWAATMYRSVTAQRARVAVRERTRTHLVEREPVGGARAFGWDR